jgi:5'-nucleotidase
MAPHVTFTPLPTALLPRLGLEDTPRVDPARRVYTNRDLDMSEIRMVGFDMDYTLAIYKKQAMEQLQYDLTVRSLVERCGYPTEIAELKYDPGFIIRGLTVDKRTGVLLKMDTHGNVERCFRGLRRVEREETHRLYRNAVIKMSSDDFASLDTLFAMPEACLYANLVDWFERRLEQGLPTEPLTLPADHETPNLTRLDTWKLFHDVRKAIDDIHRDGTLKSIIVDRIDDYIAADEGLAVTLHKLRSAGKRLFLLTNSYWPYTDALMKFLLDGRLPEYPSWRGYFDIAVVGGRKPSFFTQREPFLEVKLDGTDGAVVDNTPATRFERGRVYQGGNMETFELLAGCAGQEILYVGDHIFGDILRSKKDSRWRTCLVVEELEEEISQTLSSQEDLDKIALLDEQRHQIDDTIANQRALLARLELAFSEFDDGRFSESEVQDLTDCVKHLRREIDQAKRVLRSFDKEVRALVDVVEQRFNPSWGKLFKDGAELSRFGAQVSLYADTYTSRVSNLLQYSPMHYFRAPRELMSHDYAIANSRGLSNVRRVEDD